MIIIWVTQQRFDVLCDVAFICEQADLMGVFLDEKKSSLVQFTLYKKRAVKH